MKLHHYLILGAVIVTSLLSYSFIAKGIEKMKADKAAKDTKK